MSGSFSNATVTYISMTAGSAGAVGSGAYTIAVLVQPATNTVGFASTLASGTINRELLEDTGALFGQNDFSSGFGALTNGTWYVAAQSKPAGSNTYRHHLWAYASDGSGTMSHGVSTGSANQGDGSTADELRVGSNDNRANGLIAVVAYWTRALSDAELDTLKSSQLSAWRDVSGGPPAELISLENWNGSTGCTAVIGTSSQSSVTGTISSGANPPSFNFSLSGLTAVPLIAPGRSGPGGRWKLPPFDTTSAPTSVNAAAENTTATGAAFDATVSITANADQTAGTGAANDAQAAVGVNAENTTGTGVANAAAVDEQVNADNTAGTGTANDGQAAIAVNAENTAATGTAFDATVSTAANTSANAENTAGTGAANDAAVAVSPTADVSAATGSAFDASISITVNAENTAASGSAPTSAAGVGGQADVASASGAALAASLAIQANAEATAALGAALDAVVAIPGNANAGSASAVGTAYNARTQKLILRPNTGVTVRPNTGTTARPDTGITQRP